jgi:hypothetical protein
MANTNPKMQEKLEQAEAKTDSLLTRAAAGLTKLAASRYSLWIVVGIVVVAGVLWFIFKK